MNYLIATRKPRIATAIAALSLLCVIALMQLLRNESRTKALSLACGYEMPTPTRFLFLFPTTIAEYVTSGFCNQHKESISRAQPATAMIVLRLLVRWNLPYHLDRLNRLRIKQSAFLAGAIIVADGSASDSKAEATIITASFAGINRSFRPVRKRVMDEIQDILRCQEMLGCQDRMAVPLSGRCSWASGAEACFEANEEPSPARPARRRCETGFVISKQQYA